MFSLFPANQSKFQDFGWPTPAYGEPKYHDRLRKASKCRTVAGRPNSFSAHKIRDACGTIMFRMDFVRAQVEYLAWLINVLRVTNA